MKDGEITLSGTGVVIEKVTEIRFYCTALELDMLAKRLRELEIGDSTTVFSADGYFEEKPVRFIVKLKQ